MRSWSCSGTALCARGRLIEWLSAPLRFQASQVPGLYLGRQGFPALFPELLTLPLDLVVQIVPRSSRHYHYSTSRYEASDHYANYRIDYDQRYTIRRVRADGERSIENVGVSAARYFSTCAVSAVQMIVSRQITHTHQGSNSLLILSGEYRLRDSSDITRTLLLV